MIRANGLKISVGKNREAAIRAKLSKQYRIKAEKIGKITLKKLSIDARNKNDIKWVCNVDFEVAGEEQVLKKNKTLVKASSKEYTYPSQGEKTLKNRPVIVGFGPAGMFAGLLLSEMGYRPIILERGSSVEDRSKAVDEFWASGDLSERTNVQFGEGGAGTFSDGKLTTRIKDIRCQQVMNYLVACGGPEEILYLNKPHIGTDVLKTVVVNIREKIIEMGGEVRFNTQVTDFVIEDDKIVGLKLESGQLLQTEQVILGIGHSARDTFRLLKNRNISITGKPFAIGARIEHPQWLIDESQYGDKDIRAFLGAAEYALTHQAENGRSVYTFCMCPGGSVVASASAKGQVVTNGMSEHARDKENANSALLVGVTPEDFEGNDPLAGMYFQENLENKAFELGGSNYHAPITRVKTFLGESVCKHNDLNKLEVKPSYTPGTVEVSFDDLLPNYMTDAMREGIRTFGRRIKGFDMDQAVLTAVETRTSSPIRIVRDNMTLESLSTPGLYPCGEGAGYAGGIISSAVDGIKCAEKIIEMYQPFSKE
jgi:uncharacterized FAD-dependent dehydrogenase